MKEENCTGNCSQCGGCNGCSEKVVLSCNPKLSFVSTITFSARNFTEDDILRLVIECVKADTTGECYAGIRFYKSGEFTGIGDDKKYELKNNTLSCLNLDFKPISDCDKAEIKVFCENGATLEIEHINVIIIKKGMNI